MILKTTEPHRVFARSYTVLEFYQEWIFS